MATPWLFQATNASLASAAGSTIKATILDIVYQIPIYSSVTHLLLYSWWEMGKKEKKQ